MSQTPEKDSPEKKKPFIHETITGSGKQNQQIGRKVLLTVGLAAVFGVTASLTFVVAQPFWEARFGETETSENITIARDDITEAPVSTESETSRETESETSRETESETNRETESETGTQPAEESRSERETGSSDDWENRVQAMINNDLADLNDYKSMYNALNNITIRANKSLVTVTASSTDTDWFDQPFSSEQETCGIIVGKTAKEYLILVDADLLDGVDNLNVTFGIYGTGSAYLKQSDGILDLAVIGVPLDTLSNGVEDHVEVISLGNSYLSMQGQPVIAIGRPLGLSRSVAYGMISYVNPNISGTDMTLRLMQTDIVTAENARGMLINSDGELIGWLTEKFGAKSTDGMLSALSISDIKQILEKLFNGQASACLGVRGQNVTDEIAQVHDMPVGIYITRCLDDRPAFLAGLQIGDILTGINDTKIVTVKDLQTCLEKLQPGDVVTVTVQRSGREGYKEIQTVATLQSR